MHDFHERVLEGLKQKSTYKMMIWGDDVEFAQLENQNKVISAMSEEEKNGEKRISKDVKQEIAEVTQMSLEDVSDTLRKYR